MFSTADLETLETIGEKKSRIICEKKCFYLEGLNNVSLVCCVPTSGAPLAMPLRTCPLWELGGLGKVGARSSSD